MDEKISDATTRNHARSHPSQRSRTPRHYKEEPQGPHRPGTEEGPLELAFPVPPDSQNILTRFGIPKGNITVWDATAQGTKVMDVKLSTGLSTFYAARASRKKFVTAFFTTDESFDLKNPHPAERAPRPWPACWRWATTGSRLVTGGGVTSSPSSRGRAPCADRSRRDPDRGCGLK